LKLGGLLPPPPTILVSSMRMEGDNGLLRKVRKLLP